MAVQQRKTKRNRIRRSLNRLRIAWSLIFRISDINGGLVPSLRITLRIFRNDGLKGILAYIQEISRQEWLSQHVNISRVYRDEYSFSEVPMNRQQGRIGVHVFFSEIGSLQEIKDYLSHIPYEYDLFLSVRDTASKDILRDKWKKCGIAGTPKIKIVPDRGGHISSVFFLHAEDILKKDYVCHIHTRCRQPGQCKHILHNLLGSATGIVSIFNIFSEHKEVGLVYSEPHPGVPYTEYAECSNTELERMIFQTLNLNRTSASYIDFPAEGMFWAKVDAIRPLLNLRLSREDLRAEECQSGSGLAGAIRKSLVPLVRSRGMTFAEVNAEKKVYRLNAGDKNLWQYWDKTGDELCRIIDDFEVISFDIFDTLITRPLLDPDAAFEIVQTRISRELKIDISYARERKQAEFRLRTGNEFTGDCTLDDIYAEFLKSTKLPRSSCESIKEIEIQNEIALCIPRREMVKVFDYAKSKNKRIILISDMYLRRRDIEQMLLKCGLSGYDEIILSSELGKRKDTGALWDHYKDHIGNDSICLHIGDNERSDYRLPTSRGLSAYHVMSGRGLFHNTNFGNAFLEKLGHKTDPAHSAVTGTIVAKEFNSPFALHPARGKYAIQDLSTMGYVVFGPIVITFITWLIKNAQRDNADMLLFLAREGYFLEKLYNKILDCLEAKGRPLKRIESRYFLASRRATSLASVFCEDDLQDLLEAPYTGTLSYLLFSRFGIDGDGIPNILETVSLPEDGEKVWRVISLFKKEILQEAEIERNNYLEYCRGMGLSEYENIAVVDLGYSGSMQYYLSKIMKEPTLGYYFVTIDHQLKGIRYPGSSMKDCFGYKNPVSGKISPVYAYVLVLEGLLTSPDGQFMKFERENKRVNPVFGKPGFSQKVFDSISRIHAGALDYVEDMVKHHGDYLLDLTFSPDMSHFLMEYVVEHKTFLSDEIQNIFSVDDKYSSERDVSVFDLYREHYGMTG